MDWGFEMNLYESCCWNKMINGKQFTIVSHVDDLKLSHKDDKQVSDIITKLESIYATIYSMAVRRGKLHYYLGITTDLRVQGEVQITMHGYIKKLVKSLPDDMKVNNHMAAPKYLLWSYDEEASKLLTELSDLLFHNITAQYYELARLKDVSDPYDPLLR